MILANTTQPDWAQWLPTYNALLVSLGVALFIVVAGFVFISVFGKFLGRYAIRRTLWLAVLAAAAYAAALVMVRSTATGGAAELWTHRIFVAMCILLSLQVIDRMIVRPILTRSQTIPMPRFAHQIIMIVLYLLAAMGYVSAAFQINLGAVFVGLGGVSIVLGLALQETLGNFFSGMVLQASTPFQEGDWIDVGGTEGRVVGMSWRAVTIQTTSGNYLMIPNAVMSRERITNYHFPTPAMSHSLLVPADYYVPPHEVRAILLSAAAEADGVMPDHPPIVLLEDFGNIAMMYRVVFWVDHPSRRKMVEQSVRANIWYRFRQRGIDIPYANRPGDTPIIEKKMAARREAELRSRKVLLKKTRLFAGLEDAQLNWLAANCSEVLLPAGLTIYHQGDAGESFFVVKQGVVDLFMRAQDGRQHDIADVVAGETFGELSTLTGQPRPATMRAQTDVVCVEIRREQMNDLFQQKPEVMAIMSQVIAEQQRQREEALARLGARPAPESRPDAPNSILARMRKLFGRFTADD